MGSVCCIEKKDGNDEQFDVRKGGGQKHIQPGIGISGPHNNPFKHRAGEGYEEMRAQKEAQAYEE